jgi:type II secretory pathway pseudopilin PulG
VRAGLVVVALAAAVLPGWVVARNVLGAVERGRQKRTMGDMRTIATAVESFSIDEGSYPVGAGVAADLAALLEPTYCRKLPVEDGWGNPITYAGDGKGYVVASRGTDGRWARDQPRGAWRRPPSRGR